MASDDVAPGPDDDLPVDVGAEAEPPADVLDQAAAAVAEGEAAIAAEQAGIPPEVGQVAAERDEYLEALLRVKADFENSKKRWDRERGETVARATVDLVTQLLPVLDACSAAVEQGAEDVEPIGKALREVLEREGLAQIADVGEPFDPNLHEAVLFEEAEGDDAGQVVVESMRTGYQLKGVVLRAAMVKVRG